MYRPFDATCQDCGGPLVSHNELHPDNTQPRLGARYIPIDFWCPACMSSDNYDYRLPVLYDDVAKNVMLYIRKEYGLHKQLLGQRLSLNTSNIEEGLRYALAYMQNYGVVYDIDEDDLSFKLTLLGQLLLWHGSY